MLKRQLLPLTLILSLIFLSASSLQAQEYVKMMEEPGQNFYEVQKSFEQYWDGREVEKGKGWKQFKRWEYFMEPRVFPTGDPIDPMATWRTYNDYKAGKSTVKNRTSGMANWKQVGPSVVAGSGGGAGRVNFVRFFPGSSDTIFVGSPAGGMWRSNDAGLTWSTTTDQLAVIGCSDLAINPTNTNIMYLATSDGDGGDTYSIGVLKSLDGGLTWGTSGLNWDVTQTRRISRLRINPSNPDIVIAATSNGVYRTTNAGQSWLRVQTGNFKDLELMPNNPSVVFAANGSTIYKSINGGQNFSQAYGIGGASRIALAVTEADSLYLYALVAATNNGLNGVYRSTDAGVTFTQMTSSSTPNIMGWHPTGNDTGGQGWYDLCIAASPFNKNLIHTGGVNIWSSPDGGTNWNIRSHWYGAQGIPYCHADIHDLNYSPAGELFSGNDGGIFKNVGNSWQDLSDGLEILQSYKIGASATDTTLVLTGNQDNGTYLKDGSTWDRVIGGDGMECLIDWSNPNIMYGEIYYGSIRRSMNGGNSFQNITNSISQSGAWVTPFEIDPVNPQKLYAGFSSLYISTDRGNNWSSVSAPGGGTIRVIEIAKSNPDYIYYSKSSNVYRSTNNGTSFTQVSSGLPNQFITDIAVSEADPLEVWVTMSGYNSTNKVFHSINGGQTWANITGSLPNLPANCITFQRASNGAVYMGMDVGVYYRDNTMNDWVLYQDGLPNVMVYELEINYVNNKLRAGTYGRGLWEAELFSPVALAPVANFQIGQLDMCAGSTVNYTDLSLYAPQSWQWFFPGGSPMVSNDTSPQVTYANPGTYSAKLIVQNGLGYDTMEVLNAVTFAPTVGAVNFPFNIGFENASFPDDLTDPFKSWSVETPGTYARTIAASTAGLASMRLDVSSISTGDIAKITTPTLDLSNLAPGAMLNFKMAYQAKYASSNDQLKIYVSSDCGQTWGLRFIAAGSGIRTATGTSGANAFIPTAAEWVTKSVNIANIIGDQNALVRFETTNNGGGTLYIDEVTVNGTVLAVDDALAESLRLNIYPNPAQDRVSLSYSLDASSNVRIELMDAVGRTVLRTEKFHSAGQQQEDLSLGHLAEGLYLIKITVNGSSSVHKVVKTY